MPGFVDVPLAVAVAGVVARWSAHVPVLASMPAPPLYLPRARVALVMLVVVASLLGLRALPTLHWRPAQIATARSVGGR